MLQRIRQMPGLFALWILYTLYGWGNQDDCPFCGQDCRATFSSRPEGWYEERWGLPHLTYEGNPCCGAYPCQCGTVTDAWREAHRNDDVMPDGAVFDSEHSRYMPGSHVHWQEFNGHQAVER